MVRGGYGLYYLGQNERGAALGFSQRTDAIVSTNGNLTPAVDITNAFINQPGQRLLDPVGSSRGAASFLGQSVSENYYNRSLPYSHQFSFDIQRELPAICLPRSDMRETSRAAFQSAVRRGITSTFLPASALGRRTASGAIDTAWYTERVPNPMQGLIPDNANLNGATIPRQQLLVPFPQFSQLSLQNLPIGRQSYNGLQTKLTKRFSQGFTFVASYAFSKTLEQLTLLNPQDLVLNNIDATPLEKRSATETDVPHKFTFAGVLEVPVGKGKRFGSALPKVADYAFGGWQLNWNLALQSGWAIDYPNAKQVQSGDANPTDEQRSQGYLINTSLWTNPATGRLVGSQEQFTLRDFPTRFSNVRVPGYKNLDASISKTFPVTETCACSFGQRWSTLSTIHGSHA